MRLFVAVALPDRLARLLQAAVAADPGLRAMPAENLHVTVHFLGTVDPGRVPVLTRALAAACAGLEQFDLVFEAVVPAPRRRPRMLWARAAPSPGHAALAHAVAEAAAEAAPRARPPRTSAPHVTLARARGRGEGVRWPAAVALADGTLHVQECGLVRSEPGPDGSRYTVLARLPLGDQSARRR
ncbi:MAG TPA: RNA 2',3'-cyclic phosphodiesterase [Gaiellales bacterium]|jgi:2'-5' RNA ligase